MIPAWAKTALTFAGLIVVTYIGICALVYAFQDRLLYQPWKPIGNNPGQLGMEYRDIRLVTEDGVHLGAWFVPGEAGRPVVLVCHGNAGNISNRIETLYVYRSLGYGVFIFDYRGYGESEGSPDEEGTYRDGKAAWDYIIGNNLATEDQIIVLGRSLGGGVASWLATEVSPAGLILESTFTSVPDLAKKMYPFLPVGYLTRNRYETLKRLPLLACPVLVVHSPSDEIIPFRHGQKLYEQARDPRRFLQITGPHNGGYLLSGETYMNGVQAFITFCTSSDSLNHPANRD